MERLAVLAACVLGIFVLTGTGAAAGAGNAWQDIWAQIKPLLSDPGTINNEQNPVHWTKLNGVPASLADGLDNGVDRAGFGLEKNLFPALEFAVDTTKVQRRVTGACPVGQAVRSIGVDGAVSCGLGAPVVYHGWDSAQKQLHHNYATVGGELSVPAGSWSLAAKLELNGRTVMCKLEARANGTVSVRDDMWATGETRQFTTTLMGVHSSATPWRAAVACRKLYPDDTAWWFDVKITVTRAGELHTAQLGF